MPREELPKKGKDILDLLKKRGFKVKSQKGSHVKLTGPNGKGSVIVPNHGSKEIPLGTRKNIEKQAQDTMFQQVKNVDFSPNISNALGEADRNGKNFGKKEGNAKRGTVDPRRTGNKNPGRRKGK